VTRINLKLSTAALLAVIFATAALNPKPAQSLDFDQGVNASESLAAARENARIAPVPAMESVEVRAASSKTPATHKAAHDDTYTEREVLEAIADLGGDISGSVADIIAAIFQKSGRPTGVIVGEELQGSFIVGYRQGRGKVKFKSARGAEKLVWRAPSIGFNVGASANKVTILVYNAKDHESLLRTFASIQGSYHFILGGGVTYLHAGGINLAHVAVGVGFDAGVAVEGLTFRRD
jgi:hypothetical protein